MVSTVRTPEEDLKLFVNYHLNCGVSRVFLFFDDPNDPALGGFQGDPRITAIRCDAAHWLLAKLGRPASIEDRQKHNANLALQWAREEGISWIAHVDSDELIVVPGANIPRHLDECGRDCDVVRFPTLEAVPKAAYVAHPFREIEWFKTGDPPPPGAEKIARLLGCRRVLESGNLKGHAAGKSAVRVHSNIASMGIHSPVPTKGVRLVSLKSTHAFLLHFDCCTFDEWNRKWKRRLDGTGTAVNLRPARKQQFADFVAASQTGSAAELASLYRRQYLVPAAHAAVLAALGLMKRVSIDSRLFSAPSAP